jgi:hypothetical protein
VVRAEQRQRPDNHLRGAKPKDAGGGTQRLWTTIPAMDHPRLTRAITVDLDAIGAAAVLPGTAVEPSDARDGPCPV